MSREGEYSRGREGGYPWTWNLGYPLPLLLTRSGSHQNIYGWQAGGTHPTGMLSYCLSNRKFDRLVGPLDEIVTVSLHKYVIMSRPNVTSWQKYGCASLPSPQLFSVCFTSFHVQGRIFSGIQPTGIPHIGNFVGAIQHWVKLQQQFPSALFCIVDLHALTTNHEPGTLK